MHVPEQLLAARVRASVKVVLQVLWQTAEGEPAWTGIGQTGIARKTSMPRSTVAADLDLLIERGAARRETREVAGRRVRGYQLNRSMTADARSVRPGGQRRPTGRTVDAASVGLGPPKPEPGRVLVPRSGSRTLAAIEAIADGEVVVVTAEGARRRVALYQDGRFPRVGGYKLTEQVLRPGSKSMLQALQEHVKKGAGNASRTT